MSDAHNEHEAAIKTPKQLIAVVIAGFLVPIICIVLLVQFVTNAPKEGAGSDAATEKAVLSRIAPEATVAVFDASAPKQLLSAEEVYKSSCVACHGAGIAGAPKTGDAGQWGPRLSAGYATVLKHAIEGLRAMPPKGGNPDLDDVEVARAVVFMANQSGGKFAEPK